MGFRSGELGGEWVTVAGHHGKPLSLAQTISPFVNMLNYVWFNNRRFNILKFQMRLLMRKFLRKIMMHRSFIKIPQKILFNLIKNYSLFFFKNNPIKKLKDK